MMCAAGAGVLTSCQSLPSLSRTQGAEPTESYDHAANGGYSSGDFYGGGTNPYGTPMDVGYDPAYAASYPESFDSVNVIPFTDNGSGGVEAPDPPPRPVVAQSAPRKPAGSSPAVSSRTVKVAKTTTRPTAVATKAAKTAKKTKPAPPKTHVVKRGETLIKLSRTYNTSVPVLKKKNSLSGDLIRVGQKLVVN